MYQRLGADAWGHSVLDLLTGLREKIDVKDELLEAGKGLGRFYIPARYPNSWASNFHGQGPVGHTIGERRDRHDEYQDGVGARNP